MSHITTEQFDIDVSDSEDEGNAAEPRRGQASKPVRKKKISNKASDKVSKSIEKSKKTRRHTSKKAKKTGVRASAASILACAAAVRKAVDDTWATAQKSDMNQRPCVKDSSKTRTQHIIRRSAFNVAAAGAVTHAVACLRESSEIYNVDPPNELTKSPWLPSVTPGARVQLQYFMAAYAQNALRAAMIARKESTNRSRTNHDLMKIGFEHADRAVFDSANFGQSRTAATYLGEYVVDGDKKRKAASLKRMQKAAEHKK